MCSITSRSVMAEIHLRVEPPALPSRLSSCSRGTIRSRHDAAEAITP